MFFAHFNFKSSALCIIFGKILKFILKNKKQMLLRFCYISFPLSFLYSFDFKRRYV